MCNCLCTLDRCQDEFLVFLFLWPLTCRKKGHTVNHAVNSLEQLFICIRTREKRIQRDSCILSILVSCVLVSCVLRHTHTHTHTHTQTYASVKIGVCKRSHQRPFQVICTQSIALWLQSLSFFHIDSDLRANIHKSPVSAKERRGSKGKLTRLRSKNPLPVKVSN